MNKSLTEIVLSSSIHGIPNILRKKQLAYKLLWIFSTFISTIICVWFLYDTIIVKYLSYSVVTKIETIYEQPTIFPTISICTTKSDYFRNNDLNKTFKYCWFSYDTKCFTSPEKYFNGYEDSEFGYCYRFNSGKNMTGHSIPILNSTVGGQDDSLLLATLPMDFVIWIHNSLRPPKREYHYNYQGDVNFATRSSYTHFIIEKTIEKKLGKPYNPCLDDLSKFKSNKTLINHIQNENGTYTQMYCLELCFDLIYIESNSCNCLNVSIGNVWQNCYGTKGEIKNLTSNCTMNFKKDFYSKKILEVCSKYCPQECQQETYSVSVKSLVNIIPETRMFFYFKSLSYTSITQEPVMNVNDVVAEVGGILGLFLGKFKI